MNIPSQSLQGVGEKTDCSFETYETDIRLVEPDTKCPVVTPDGSGLITASFIK